MLKVFITGVLLLTILRLSPVLFAQQACDDLWWNNKLRTIDELESDTAFFDSLKANIPRAARCPNWRGLLGLTNGMTYIFFGKGELDSAYHYSQQAYTIAETHLDQLGDTAFPVINAFNDYGAIQYYFLGNVNKRIELLERAAQTIEKMASMEGVSLGRLEQDLQITFHNLAAIYAQLGDYDEAIRVYRRVISLKEQLPAPEPAYLAPSYAELGKVYLEKGDWKQALIKFQQALDIIRRSAKPLPELEANYLYHIAQVYLKTDFPDKAQEHILLSKKLDPAAFSAENEVISGEIFLRQNKADEALSHFYAALEKALEKPAGKQKLIAEIYELMARGQLKKKEFSQAIRSLHAGLAFLAKEKKESDDLFYFPQKDAIDFPFEAIALLETKALIAKASVPAGLLSRAEMQAHNSKAFELALALCQEQIASFRADDSKLFWVEKMSGLVHQQVSLQVEMYEQGGEAEVLEKAFKAAGLLKAAVLREAIADARALNQIAVPNQLNNRIAALKFDCVKLERKLAAQPLDTAVQQQLHAAQRGLERANDSLFDLLKNSSIGAGLYQQPGLKDIQQSLDDSTQLIQYAWLDSQLVIFSIHRDSCSLFVSNEIPLLERHIRELSLQLARSHQSNNGSLAVAARGLYFRLLQPLGRLKPRLVIVPDGPLFELPFAALLTGDAQSHDFASWPWLVKKHAVSYSSSATLFLGKTNQSLTHFRKWMGLAPVRFGNGLASLPLSEQELAGVGKALGSKGTVLLNEQANKTAFLSAISHDFSLIHFSTHASSNGNFPKNSWLALAGEGDSARLFLDELYALPLKTQLVVLSACETQSGMVNSGEGIMSLARAFRYAGSEAVLATLWPSDELASRWLIEAFYQELARGLSKDEALRQAQLRYLSEAELPADKMHPAYWAPFVATGDMSPLKTGGGWSYWWMLILLPVTCGFFLVFGEKGTNPLFLFFEPCSPSFEPLFSCGPSSGRRRGSGLKKNPPSLHRCAFCTIPVASQKGYAQYHHFQPLTESTMKTQSIFFALILMLSASLMTSCITSDEPGLPIGDPYSSWTQFLQQNQVQPKAFTLDPRENNEIQGPKGTVVRIPSRCPHGP
ncbi:MAG: CHAT domain-containing protein [Bacteroidia bacterium]